MKLLQKPLSIFELLILKFQCWIQLKGKWVSNLSLCSETDVIANLTTFESVWRVQKLGNGPQEGPGDREEAWGAAWNANLGEMGNLSLQKEELPKLLCVVLYTWEDGHSRVREAYGNEMI